MTVEGRRGLLCWHAAAAGRKQSRVQGPGIPRVPYNTDVYWRLWWGKLKLCPYVRLPLVQRQSSKKNWIFWKQNSSKKQKNNEKKQKKRQKNQKKSVRVDRTYVHITNPQSSTLGDRISTSSLVFEVESKRHLFCSQFQFQLIELHRKYSGPTIPPSR